MLGSVTSPPTLPFRPNSPTLAAEIKEYMARHRRGVEELIEAGDEGAGERASLQWARVFDGLVSALFGSMRGVVGTEKVWKQLSLAAVGSWGRGGLGFKSDLDVRILCNGPTSKVAPVAEALLYPLWDAGLSIGHQVVTQSEMVALAKKDLPTATTLLDWRFLCGDEAAANKMLEKAFDTVFSSSNIHKFLEEIGQQAEERRHRFGDSVYLLEPDVKSGQGGLRDLDVVHWTGLARWRARGIKSLVNIGVLLPREHEQLEQAARFLYRVRNVLHLRTKRRTDRLSFDRQEELAQVMGYGTGGPGVEGLMSDYYRHARVISNAREMLLGRAAPPPKKRQREQSLGNGIKLFGEAVTFEDPNRLMAEPALALRLYTEAVRRELPVFRFARDAVARATTSDEFCERLRKSEEAARLFRRLVRAVRRTSFRDGSVLTELHDVGLLLAMIPEFAPVVGRVHHDIYHVYTVDVHSIAAVDRLRALSRGELAEEHPLASRLAAEVARPQVLFMAALLHDIGKDIGGRNHSQRGFELARTILERLQVQEHDIVEIQHLVLKHLRMYMIASRRDLDDPQTIESFQQEVHGPEGLKELYLLTLADVSTTSPQALTAWKARMLEQLYLATEETFQGLPPRTEQRAEGIRQAVLGLCPASGEREFLDYFLQAVPERYLYANEPEYIVKHSRFVRQAQMQRFTASVMGQDEPYAEVGFVADDRPGLLAMITAALAANRLRVASAQIYSWTDSYGRARVLDLFWVRSGSDTAAVADALPKVERDFERLLSQEVTPEQLVDSRRPSTAWDQRPAPDVSTAVSIDNRSGSSHSILEVTTRDRAGLLFRLANVIQGEGLSIALAKINTEGNQVADVFYVTDKDGAKLSDVERVEALKTRIVETIENLALQERSSGK